jgi:Site-specific recombinase XerC
MINPKNKTQTTYLKDAIETYENCIARGMTIKTAKGYRSAVNQYITLTNPTITETATYQDFRPSLLEFLDYCRNGKQIGHSALQNHFNALNNYYAYLKDIGRVSINPIPDFRALYIKSYKTPDTREIIQLTTADIEQLILEAQSPLWRAVIGILALTGMRREELTSLDVGSVDFDKRLFHIKERPKRTNKRAPFTDFVLSLVLDYLEVRIN